ncbi:hypothetical protein FB451DRAFT_1224914 [Mycena latifolia]|nr:hypothetical protein FB451DRAFT_1224914 [Mycena latifolia]
MRPVLVRAFSTSARRARQPLFEIKTLKPSNADRAFLQSSKWSTRRFNRYIDRDVGVIRSVFLCECRSLRNLRAELAKRISTALAKLQDPEFFRVEDLTFDNMMGSSTIGYPSELALIDLTHPLGVPPHTPKLEFPPIYDPSLVAQALSEAGLTGSFFHVDKLTLRTSDFIGYAANKPWPHYERVPFGGFVYPPQLHIDADKKLGPVTLTLPGATVQPLYNLFRWFSEGNVHFRAMVSLVTLWARSHSLPLNPQTIALMVIASMQSGDPLFDDWGEKRGWSSLDHKRDSTWSQAIERVDVDFKHARWLPYTALDTAFSAFIQLWSARSGELSKTSAFTVRGGRTNQLIPRENYVVGPPSSARRFSLSDINHPTLNFSPWCYDRLVIQDPFLVTHNHAGNLTARHINALYTQLRRAVRLLQAGRPLASIFGPHAAPPGSVAERRMLQHPQTYSAALKLLGDRNPEDMSPSDSEAPVTPAAETSAPSFPVESFPRDAPDPRLRRVPWGRRGFHTSSVALGKRKFPQDSTISPPRPPARKEKRDQQKLKSDGESDGEGWGLNPAPIREPEFWRPGREPLQLPVRTDFTSPVPPVRASKAGVAYKSVSSGSKGFHTSAVCSGKLRSRQVVIPRGVDRSVLESRRATLLAVEDAIRKEYGGKYAVNLFGSTLYGISSASSDLDMVILDPTRPHGWAPDARPQGKIYHIKTLANVLGKAGFKVIEAVDSASVPIVKFKDPRTGHSCDINVNDRLGLLNSELIRRYCELNPILVNMIMYIKAWAKPLGLNSPTIRRGMPVTFSSYALVMMTIGFLQYRGLLPNLQEGLPPLENGKLEGTFWLRKPRILCCDVRFNLAEGWMPPKDVSVDELLRDWFKFWASEFDVAEEMISIRHGGRVRRHSVADRTDYSGVLWNIDPFIRTKNITAHIGRASLAVFIMECRAMIPDDFEPDTLPGAQKSPAEDGDKPMPVAEWLPAEEDELLVLWQTAPRKVGGMVVEPPTIRIDAVGRLIVPVKPPPPPINEEVEKDEVGFGIKAAA